MQCHSRELNFRKPQNQLIFFIILLSLVTSSVQQCEVLVHEHKSNQIDATLFLVENFSLLMNWSQPEESREMTQSSKNPCNT
jgi:hypothetical protein